jgi:hypothetical protein
LKQETTVPINLVPDQWQEYWILITQFKHGNEENNASSFWILYIGFVQ